MTKIFIQIAAYRDPELLPTLNSLLSNAKYPDNLTFGLVWQHDKNDEWDNLKPYLNDKRFKILDVPHEESGGMFWARSKTQSLYDGEEYTMQLDSHMRFAKDWDADLLSMMDYLGKLSNKPFLTGYAFQYEPENDSILNPVSSTLCPIAFHTNGLLLFKSFANKKNYDKPYKARLVGGHFFLTLGSHCVDYVYDPNLYYLGDELTLAVRSYTLGYDLYHPHKNVAWHYYKRSSNKKHWDNFEKQKKEEKENKNVQRIQQMLRIQDHGLDLENYGLGKSRTLSEYESFSGIYFKDRRILKSAMMGTEPPIKFKNKYLMEKDFIKTFDVEITDWQRPFILAYKNNLDYMKLDLMSLDKNILESVTMPISFVENNEVIKLKHTGENKPVCYSLSCYAKGVDKPKIQVNKDLEKDLNFC